MPEPEKKNADKMLAVQRSGLELGNAMIFARVVLLLALVANASLAAAEQTDRVDQISSQILAYESLYKHARIRYKIKSKQGGFHHVNYLVRRDRTMIREDQSTSNSGSEKRLQTRIFSTEKTVRWDHGETRVIHAQSTNRPQGLIPFRLCSAVGKTRSDAIRILEDADSGVAIRCQRRPDYWFVTQFEQYGPYLRPLSHKQFLKDAESGQASEVNEYRFTYPPWTEPTLDTAGPLSVVRISKVHDIRNEFVYIEFDFEPRLSVEDFDIHKWSAEDFGPLPSTGPYAIDSL